VIPGGLGHGASEIGLPDSLKEFQIFLFKTIEVAPLSGSGHPGVHGGIKDNNMVWADITLNQCFKKRNSLLRNTTPPALVGKGRIGETVA
jgi:hypothetical protein